MPQASKASHCSKHSAAQILAPPINTTRQTGCLASAPCPWRPLWGRDAAGQLRAARCAITHLLNTRNVRGVDGGRGLGDGLTKGMGDGLADGLGDALGDGLGEACGDGLGDGLGELQL